MEAFFLGFNHTPSDLRQSKAHWLAKTKYMMIRCWFHGPWAERGPVMTQLLANDNHYKRLVDVLPNLNKLRLAPTSNKHQRDITDKHWSHLSLPAKCICYGPESTRLILDGVGRVDPHTIMCHGHSGVRYERTTQSTVDQIIISRTLEAPPPGRACQHINITDYTQYFRLFINGALDGILPFLVTDREKFIFRLYGWFESCECGGTREGFVKIANSLKFVNWHLEYELRLDIKFEFFPLEDKQVCEVCGE